MMEVMTLWTAVVIEVTKIQVIDNYDREGRNDGTMDANIDTLVDVPTNMVHALHEEHGINE